MDREHIYTALMAAVSVAMTAIWLRVLWQAASLLWGQP